MRPAAALARAVGRYGAFRARRPFANSRDRLGPAFGEKQRAQARTDFVLAADLERVDSDAIHVTDRERSYNPNTHSGLGEPSKAFYAPLMPERIRSL